MSYPFVLSCCKVNLLFVSQDVKIGPDRCESARDEWRPIYFNKFPSHSEGGHVVNTRFLIMGQMKARSRI